MPVVLGHQGAAAFRYGEAGEQYLELGVHAWKLTVENEVQRKLLTPGLYAEAGGWKAVRLLPIPFVVSTAAVLEFTMFYDSDSVAFRNAGPWFQRGVWECALALVVANYEREEDGTPVQPFGTATPIIRALGYLQGMEAVAHVRTVPTFTVRLALYELSFLLDEVRLPD